MNIDVNILRSLSVVLTMAAEEVKEDVQSVSAKLPNIELTLAAASFSLALLSARWRMVVYSASSFR